eukprot:sb/3469190/
MAIMRKLVRFSIAILETPATRYYFRTGHPPDAAITSNNTMGNILDTGGAIQVHRVINFFMARTGVVKIMGGWDPFQRYNEHEEFFVRLIRFRLKVLFLKTFTVVNNVTEYPKDAHLDKKEMKKVYMTRFFNNYNIKYSVQCDITPHFDKKANMCTNSNIKYSPVKNADFVNGTLPSFEFIDSASYFYTKTAFLLLQSDPDLVTSSGEMVLVTKSGWALNRGQITLISYIGGNLLCH